VRAVGSGCTRHPRTFRLLQVAKGKLAVEPPTCALDQIAARRNLHDSRSPNSGAMRSTFGNRAHSAHAGTPWRATPRNPRTSPPWRPNSRVAMSSPILLWCAAPRTLRTGDALQAPPPECLAPEGGRPSPAAQRGGVGARRRGRIAGSPLDAADGVARILSELDLWLTLDLDLISRSVAPLARNAATSQMEKIALNPRWNAGEREPGGGRA